MNIVVALIKNVPQIVLEYRAKLVATAHQEKCVVAESVAENVRDLVLENRVQGLDTARLAHHAVTEYAL